MLQTFIRLATEKTAVRHDQVGFQSVNRLTLVELPVRPLALFFALIPTERVQRLDKAAIFLQRFGQLALAGSGLNLLDHQ